MCTGFADSGAVTLTGIEKSGENVGVSMVEPAGRDCSAV
jgi:hypothetical protein